MFVFTIQNILNSEKLIIIWKMFSLRKNQGNVKALSFSRRIPRIQMSNNKGWQGQKQMEMSVHYCSQCIGKNSTS